MPGAAIPPVAYGFIKFITVVLLEGTRIRGPGASTLVSIAVAQVCDLTLMGWTARIDRKSTRLNSSH